jgi:DNA-directed RNA polymerase specialized sigma24 family protein
MSGIFASGGSDIHPVKILGTHSKGGFELEDHDGRVQRFGTWKQTLSNITGGKYLTWSMGRYLRQGQYAYPNKPLATTLEMFRPDPSELVVDLPVDEPSPSRDSSEIVIDGEDVPATRTKGEEKSTETILADGIDHPIPVVEIVSEPVGIDLENRADEVMKLLFAGFGKWIARSGYDAQEVLQEVYKALLVRNQGKCPWTPEKSSFGHYVHMVCRCVMSNLHRKKRRQESREQIGVPVWKNGNRVQVDLADSSYLANMTAPDPVWELQEMEEAEESLAECVLTGKDVDPAVAKLAATIIPLKRNGMTRKEMSQLLGVAPTKVTEATRYLKEKAQTWRQTLI